MHIFFFEVLLGEIPVQRQNIKYINICLVQILSLQIAHFALIIDAVLFLYVFDDIYVPLSSLPYDKVGVFLSTRTRTKDHCHKPCRYVTHEPLLRCTPNPNSRKSVHTCLNHTAYENTIQKSQSAKTK